MAIFKQKINDMYPKITQTIQGLSQDIAPDRQAELQLLADYIRQKQAQNQTIRLNFICTHNSRRSHLGQIWAQSMAHYFGLKNVFCYSGGTEQTAMFPMVAETLAQQGFDIQSLSEGQNPVYAVKFAQNEAPVVCFSKAYNHSFNPKNEFGAILTCNSADQACPMVLGADARMPIKYEDPKAFDDTPLQALKYQERSLQIAAEMHWVFGQI
jgi:arsenate reductase (thioredoxin)